MVADLQREVLGGQKNGSFQVLMIGAAIKGEWCFLQVLDCSPRRVSTDSVF
jgi:hypothetical protein